MIVFLGVIVLFCVSTTSVGIITRNIKGPQAVGVHVSLFHGIGNVISGCWSKTKIRL